MAHSSDLILVLFIFLSSSTWTGYSQRGSDVTKMLPCMELMLPCQNYLNAAKPPKSCCRPFQHIITHSPECLCSIIFNDDMLSYLNVTFEDAVTFAFKCDIEALDISTCSFMRVPIINVDPLSSSHEGISATDVVDPVSTSHAGPSRCGVGFGRSMTSAVVVLLVTMILFFVQGHFCSGFG